VGQPGPPIRSGAELVHRLDYDALVRAWEHDPEIANLVRSMRDDLAGVRVRTGNLVAALGGALDGEVSWEDADCWVVTVPAMVAPRDADAALRVLLSDYGHFTMARKPAGQPSLLMVDEFSAIAGGRRSAIDLLERGRGAGAAWSWPASPRWPSARRRSGPGCWPPPRPSCCSGPHSRPNWPPGPGASGWPREPGRSTARS
jgi:hypothetical protein